MEGIFAPRHEGRRQHEAPFIEIHADCSLNWRDPDNGKLYCFSSAASLLSFQEWPKTNSRKANEAFERIKKEHPQS